jgi:signal transduction histidine kinase
LIQEALNNIKRHAGANRVTIRLVASSPDIVIRIKDNGKGFDVNDRRNGH